MDLNLIARIFLYLLQGTVLGVSLYSMIQYYRSGRFPLKSASYFLACLIMAINQLQMGLRDSDTWTDPTKTATQYICMFLLVIGASGFFIGFRRDLRSEEVFRTLFRRAQERFPNVEENRLQELVEEAMRDDDHGLIDNYEFPVEGA